MSMSLIQMSLAGGILILAIIVVRAIFINRMPKGTFLALWAIALLRLLLPVSIPSAFSVYTLTESVLESFGAGQNSDALGAEQEPNALGAGQGLDTFALTGQSGFSEIADAGMESLETGSTGTEFEREDSAEALGTERIEKDYNLISVWTVIWCAGAVTCALYFAASGIYLRRKFRTAVLLRSEYLNQWLSAHRLRRTISVSCSDRIEAPVTYGILRPVILLPRKMAGLLQRMDRNDAGQLELILQHEYVHIRRFDTMTKLIAVAALCVHWFNPLVWAMYFLFNRDLELACDERVVKQLGLDGRKAYALALIDMEERKSGLSPMYSGFSKNAIEERITAIMKIKKTTFGAILLAAMLVASVTTAFATSAMARTQDEGSGLVPGLGYSEEDWEKLEALRFDGYESMSVSQFQDRAWTMCDQPEYRDAIERFSMDETLYEMRDSNELAAFLFYVLDPLTAEQWRTRSFDGSVVTEYPGTSDNAILEYSLTLILRDPDGLTVKEYCDARVGISEDLRDWLLERTPEELQDAAQMWDLMMDQDKGEIPRLVKEWESESLGLNIAPFYTPLAYADVPAEDEELLRMNQAQRQDQWDEVLAPYMGFGLTYHYDQATDDFKMNFQGKEVRGIVDEEKGLWISEHAGIGTYAQDAVELYAVYEDGELTGLREATADEQRDWSEIRQKNTEGLLRGEDEARGTPGTQEDYLSLLALKTAEYETMSLAKFNQALLEWADADYGRMERVDMDAAWNDIQVPLQEDEISFVKLTVVLSGLENGERIRSKYRGREEDPVHDQYLPDRMSIDGGMGAWCNLYYQFSYHIEDMDAVTVGERDRCIKGFMESIQEFWEETDFEVMLKMEEKDVVEKLQEIAEEWSNEQVTIYIREDYVGFESMDERNRESN